MDIIKENIDDLNAVLKIKVQPADYLPQVDEVIRKHQRSARVAGFRPGKVPTGVIKKMYGKSIMADELNKLISESLYKYIGDNNLEILGNPLPNDKEFDEARYDTPTDFEFEYSVGLAPTLTFTLDAKKSFTHLVLKPDDEMINKYVEDIQRRYGKYERPEVSDEDCILYCDFTELNADGTEKEDGIKTSTTISLQMIGDEQERSKFIAQKIDATVVFNPTKAVKNDTEVAAMLSITKGEAAEMKSDFSAKITSINKIEKASLDQSLFNQLYGEGVVSTEAEFKAKVAGEIEKMFEVDGDKKLKHDIETYLLDTIKPNLPDNFLKRWLQKVNEKPITAEEVEKEYDNYANGIKLKLIENKIIAENEIKVTADEIREFARQLIINQFAQYGHMNPEEEKISELAEKYLSDRERLVQINETLSERKAFEYLKAFFPLNKKELPYDEFVKEIKASN